MVTLDYCQKAEKGQKQILVCFDFLFFASWCDKNIDPKSFFKIPC